MTCCGSSSTADLYSRARALFLPERGRKVAPRLTIPPSTPVVTKGPAPRPTPSNCARNRAGRDGRPWILLGNVPGLLLGLFFGPVLPFGCSPDCRERPAICNNAAT